ncbi:PrgI family protein [Candidatus Saccharibacteria bacterium]|nr:MAG: PrgI family protein [Candidatus Saccharibacteria bacterium]
MAVYKVAQDVEADDKLIGPFSFRQFIYLIIVAISITLAWGLAQLFVPLAIIPLPIIVFLVHLLCHCAKTSRWKYTWQHCCRTISNRADASGYPMV